MSWGENLVKQVELRKSLRPTKAFKTSAQARGEAKRYSVQAAGACLDLAGALHHVDAPRRFPSRLIMTSPDEGARGLDVDVDDLRTAADLRNVAAHMARWAEHETFLPKVAAPWVQPIVPEGIHSWRRHTDFLKEHILDVTEQDADTARKEISLIARSLEDLLSLAKAKLSQLARLLPSPVEGPLPTWASEQLRTIEGSGDVLSTVLRRSEKILAAAGTVVPAGTDAEVEQGGPGRIAIEWRIPGKYLRWIVRPTEAPWPGLDVEVLEADPDKPSALASRRFYDAPSLLEHLDRTAG